MRSYRKKPVVIQAMQYTGKNDLDICVKMRIEQYEQELTSDDFIIQTIEGYMRASPGDYIIKGICGEFYPCKENIFNMTYEEVKE